METTIKMVSALLGAGASIATLASDASAACNQWQGSPVSTGGWTEAYYTCVNNSEGYSVEGVIEGNLTNDGSTNTGEGEAVGFYHLLSGSTSQGYFMRADVFCPQDNPNWQIGSAQYFSANAGPVTVECQFQGQFATKAFGEMIFVDF